MTSTLTKTSQALAEWTKVFPLQVTETYTSSVTFIKQLTTVAVSTITYLKNAFPEENYTIDQFGGLKIRVLKNKCENELAQFLMTALTQAFEAFDKKYLHQLALCFYSEECAADQLVECHVFEYEYGPAGAALRMRSSAGTVTSSTGTTAELDAIRDRTLQLIRACMVMLSHTQLPETYDVSLRLYYNDAAPEGYQAPGFVCAGDGADPVSSIRGGTVRMGSVRTPYHQLTLRAYCRDQEGDSLGDSREAIASQNPPTITQAPDEFVESAEDGRIACSCRLQDEDPSTTLLTCRFCGTRQHAACYGLLPRTAPAPGPHCCVSCSSAGRAPHTDPALATAGNQACYAVFRRALAWLHWLQTPASTRALCARLHLTPTSARKLLTVLRSQHVLTADPPHDPDTPIEISTDHLESVIKKYFRCEEEDILERLVEESIASQEATDQDPVGDVLSPLEKVSLQDTARPARVVLAEVNNNNTDVDEETLKQYRAAMLSREEDADELPPAPAPAPAPAGRKRKTNDKPAKTGVKSKRGKTTRK